MQPDGECCRCRNIVRLPVPNCVTCGPAGSRTPIALVSTPAVVSTARVQCPSEPGCPGAGRVRRCNPAHECAPVVDRRTALHRLADQLFRPGDALVRAPPHFHRTTPGT